MVGAFAPGILSATDRVTLPSGSLLLLATEVASFSSLCIIPPVVVFFPKILFIRSGRSRGTGGTRGSLAYLSQGKAPRRGLEYVAMRHQQGFSGDALFIFLEPSFGRNHGVMEVMGVGEVRVGVRVAVEVVHVVVVDDNALWLR